MTTERLERELASLREEDAAVNAEIAATAAARDGITSAYKRSRRLRPRVIRGGVAVYEPSWVAEDEDHEAKLIEFDATIQAGNRRSRELGVSIEDRRRVLLQERKREEAKAAARRGGVVLRRRRDLRPA